MNAQHARSRTGHPCARNLLIVTGAILLLAVAALWQPVAAATKTWTGAGATEDWSLGANWSGGTVPLAADVVVFDATSVKNVTIDVNISVATVTINPGYTGTISQAATVTVGAGGWNQADGAFVGGNSTITVNGPYSLSGGSFAATTGTMTVTGNLTHSAGALVATSGTIALATSTATIDVPGSDALSNLTIVSGTKTIAAGDTLSVAGALVLADGSINTGTVEAHGSISQAAAFDGGTGTLAVAGSADQTFTGAATATAGQLPNVAIAKPSGTLTLAGTIRTARNWTYTSGALNTAGSTVVFAGGTITGSHALNAVDLRATTIVAAGTVLTVPGSLALTGGALNGTGIVDAQGSISQASTSGGGTATLRINGSADQTLTGAASAIAGQMPPVVIAKPSGTLTLAGTIRTAVSWTWTSGALNAGGSTLVFAGTLTVTGSHTLEAVEVRGTVTIAAGTTVTVLGSLTMTSGALNTGTVEAQGSINQSSGFTGASSASLVINGTADQVFAGTATATAGLLPNVVIAKPSGTLTLAGTIRTARNWTYTSGALDTTGSTLVFSSTLTVSGSMNLANLTLNGAGTIYTLSPGTTLSVAGALVLADGSINTGTVEAHGTISQASAFDGGTGTLAVAGSADQTFTGTATATAGLLPNVAIAKPSGTLTLAGTIRTARNWTYTSGALNSAGSTVVFAGTLTVTGSMALANLTFSGIGTTYTLGAGTTLTVGGALVLTDGAINAGTVEAQGSISQASAFDGGTTTMLIDGSGDQAFSGSATPTAGLLPNVVIAKPSGTLTLTGTIRTARNWTFSSGSLATAGSTLVFAGTQTVTGSMSLASLTFSGIGTSYTIAAGTTLTVAGALVLTDGAINTGTVEAHGSISQAAAFDGGTGTLLINGTTDQTFTGTATATAGLLPNVVIDKPSGTLFLAGTIRTARNWTLLSGTLDSTGATLVFAGGTVTGSQTLSNLELRATTSIASGTTLTTTGALTLTAGSLNGPGTLEAQGSISQASTSGGGTATLLINGSADQTFTGSATVTAGNLPIVVIDKPSGTLTLVGTIRTGSNWTHVAGAVTAAGSTVVFAGGIVSAAGMTFGDVEARTGTVTLAAALDVAGGLRVVSGTLNTSVGSHAVNVAGTLVVGGTFRPNGSIVTVNGDVTINGAYVAGTSTLVLSGTTGQVLGGTAAPTLAYVTIDDAGGVSLGTSITLTRTLTLIGGQFIVGPHVLGISMPIAGTPTNLSAGATSGILVTGTASGIVLPDSVSILGTLTLANPNGSRLLGDLTIASTLRFNQGNLVAEPFEVILDPAATVVRTSGHVIGSLHKGVGAGSSIGVTFEIGDASAYTPLNLVFATVLAPGSLSASTTGGEHPDIATSTIDPAQDVNRSWTLSGTFAFDAFDATINFAAPDVDPGADPTAFVFAEHDGAIWSSPTVGGRTTTSTQATGITAFGSFAVGEAAADVSVTQTALPNPVFVGQDLTYSIVVSNGGPADAVAVMLTDTLGALGSIQSATISQGSCASTASTASCALGTVSLGSPVIVTVVARTTGVGFLANDVVVTTASSDPDPADNASTLSRSIGSLGSPPPTPTPTPTPNPTPTPAPLGVIVLTDGIAPGVNRGTSGFTGKRIVVRRGGYVTFMIATNSALAGRTIEIWKRGKTGAWAMATTRLVAANGTVHYFARVSAWTAFLAKLDGATSHGRIATVRGP